MVRFAHPVAPPSPFTYTSIDPTYDVWGWRVAIERPALEFSRLVDAGAEGFELVGSGAATVTTAALFAPDTSVTVHVDDATGRHEVATVADQGGAIRVPVSLGPGNPEQQLSPQGNVWALTTGALPGTWPSVRATATFAPASDTTKPTAPSSPVASSPAAPRTGRLPATGPIRPVPVLWSLAALAVALVIRPRRPPTSSGPGSASPATWIPGQNP
jgi:hypothetical protein